MGRKFVTGITTGMLMGAAAGMLLMPELDRRTKRKMRRSAKNVRNVAGNVYDGMVKWIR